jgi:ABC-type multidrug transport system fused ATPase/permease subunit
MNTPPTTQTTQPTQTTQQVNPQTQSYIDSISNKLTTLATSISGVVTDQLMCPVGSDCYKSKYKVELKNKLDQAKQNLNDAPLELSLAEKNLYVYNDGNSGGEFIYNALIIDRFAATADDLKKNSISKQQEFMADLAQNLKQYQAEKLFKTRTDELLQTRQKENDELIRKINMYDRILQTNERKVVYENNDMTGLYTYRRIMLFLYYAAIICYIIFSNFIPDKLYTKYSVWAIIIIVSIIPIILNMVIKWLYIIGSVIAFWFKKEMPYRDVYADL